MEVEMRIESDVEEPFKLSVEPYSGDDQITFESAGGLITVAMKPEHFETLSWMLIHHWL